MKMIKNPWRKNEEKAKEMGFMHCEVEEKMVL